MMFYLWEKILTFHIIVLIKSVVNKNKYNYYYYNRFLEKGSNKDISNTQYFYMNVCIQYMLYFNTTDISEGIDVNKISESRVRCLSLLVFS